MADEKNKNPMKNLIGKYMGKKIDKEDPEWIRYKFTFKVDDKELNFNGFTPWSTKDGKVKKGIHPDKLIEANWYKISYSEYQSETMDNPSKNAICFWDSDKPKHTQLENTETKPFNLPDDSTLEQFIQQYKQSVDEKVKSDNHFIGTILLTLNGDKLKHLTDIYKEKVE